MSSNEKDGPERRRVRLCVTSGLARVLCAFACLTPVGAARLRCDIFKFRTYLKGKVSSFQPKFPLQRAVFYLVRRDFSLTLHEGG